MKNNAREKRNASPVAMTVLSGSCAAIWLCRILIRGENDPLIVTAGIAWAACAVIWGLRAVRAQRERRQKKA